ncbi:MAG: antibiotic biosynthesis monooxygenase [Thermoleophilia bacterium]|nr:hypothetical protein [Gaiellaceae bacterium]MDW8338572.1 antibiotic biosynthesis monooxygenase [Thermoleophilia bacterium]
MVYSAGLWLVEAGKEEEFVRTWEATTALVPGDRPGIVSRLVRDLDEPRRFVSLVGPWKSPEELERVRTTPAFQEALERAQPLLESVEWRTYEVVVEIS